MNLEWHIRLVDRMIKNNPDARIKDYYNIVEKEDESFGMARIAHGENVEVKNLAIHDMMNLTEEVAAASLEKYGPKKLNGEPKKRRKKHYLNLKRNWIV